MQIYTTQEYAEKLNVSEIWLRELARKGRVYPCRKVGKNWVFFGNSTVIRPPERWNRKPKKMRLPHEELTIKQWRGQIEYALEHERYSKVRNIAGDCDSA